MAGSFDFWVRGSPFAASSGVEGFDSWRRGQPVAAVDGAPDYDAAAFPIEDSFTDTAGTALEDHQGEAGAEWSQLGAFAGDVVISDANRARAAAGNGTLDAFYYASGEPPSAEYYVEAVFKFKSVSASDASAYICLRLDTDGPASDAYYAGYGLGGAVWYLWVESGGVYNELGTWAESPGDEATRTVRLVARNARKSLIVDGVERLFSTNNDVTAAGRVGMFWTAGETDSTGVHIESLEAAEVENYVLAPNDLAQSQGLQASSVTKELAPAAVSQAHGLAATTGSQNHTAVTQNLAQAQSLEAAGIAEDTEGTPDSFNAWRRGRPDAADATSAGTGDHWRRGQPFDYLGSAGEPQTGVVAHLGQSQELTSPAVTQVHTITPNALAQAQGLAAATLETTGEADTFDHWSRGEPAVFFPNAGRYDAFRRADGPIAELGGFSIAQAVGEAGDLSQAHSLQTTTVAEVESSISEYALSGYPPGVFPAVRTDHFLRYWYGKSDTGGETVDLLVRLMEGTEVIAQWSHLDISEAINTAEQELLEAQAENIDDYSALSVEFEFLFHQNGDERDGVIYWLEFEVPDPPALTLSPANVSQSHGLAASSATQLHQVSPADVAQAQALSSSGVENLFPDNLTQFHVLFAPVVSQNQVLQPADLSQAQSLGTVAILVPTDLVLISGTEYRIYENPPLEILDLVDEPSTCSFWVRDDEGDFTFERGQRVVVLDDTGDRAYAGYIMEVEEVRLNQEDGALRHVIRCTDNHYKATKRRVARSYTAETVEDIVADLITEYLEEEDVPLSTAEIDPGPTIGEAVFNYRPLSEVLDRLAELAGFWWRIDHDGVLRFKEPASEPAPWELTGADIVGTPRYSRSNPLYRNRQYIRGGRDLTDPQTFGPVAGDSVAREWTMGFPLAKVPTVLVNGVEAAVDLKMFADSHSADFYWQKGDPVIVQDSEGALLSASDDIEVTYQGEFNIIALSEDTAEVERRKLVEGGGSGIVEAVDDDSSIASRIAGLERAAALLAKYGLEAETLQFRTYRAGLRPGMVQTVDLPAHHLDQDELLITEVRTTRRRVPGPDPTFEYCRDVTEVLGASIGSWAMFFLRLTRTPSFIDRLSVGEDSVLTLLHTFAEDIGLEEDVAFSANACEFPATDLYPATDFYPC